MAVIFFFLHLPSYFRAICNTWIFVPSFQCAMHVFIIGARAVVGFFFAALLCFVSFVCRYRYLFFLRSTPPPSSLVCVCVCVHTINAVTHTYPHALTVDAD